MTALTDERSSLLNRIYGINEKTFDSVARDVFNFQLAGNSLFQSYCNLIHVDRPAEKGFGFLPISFFKSHEVRTGDWIPARVFRSSGTTGQVPSRHAVRDLDAYLRMTEISFPPAWGRPEDYTWIGLLPSYLERPDSSLVEMVRHFMARGARPESRFFKAAEHALPEALNALAVRKAPTVLIGVSFALLDFFATGQCPVWDELLVIETGGMKGRGRELTREELYERLAAFAPGVRLASEYGMTELFSQAYRWEGRFIPGPAMRVMARDVSDPLHLLPAGHRGALNIMDLGNLDTCAFIATEDTGIVYADGSFDVTGRLDEAEMRGCNLMYTG